jgi:hypothetical protein
MQSQSELLGFDEVHQAPALAGLYAWYYRINLSESDIQRCIQTVEAAPAIDDKRRCLEAFLTTFVFAFCRERPYSLVATGPLKPTYKGSLNHELHLSASMLDKLAANPHGLHDLKATLLKAVPCFASPIYIGLAKNLRERLGVHKRLIEKLRNDKFTESFKMEADPPSIDEEPEDHSFAQDAVLMRRLNPTFLYVEVLPMALDKSQLHPIENILNRINYPLCGRN